MGSLEGDMWLQSAQYSYNYVTWSGGASAYQTCDLEDRAATYVGTCTSSGYTTCNTTLSTDATDTSLTRCHLHMLRRQLICYMCC